MTRGQVVSEVELYELLPYLTIGHTTGGIARTVGVPEPTIKGRLKSLYQLLGVHDKAAAVWVAVRRGMLDHTGQLRSSGPDGGRYAAVLEVANVLAAGTDTDRRLADYLRRGVEAAEREAAR